MVGMGRPPPPVFEHPEDPRKHALQAFIALVVRVDVFIVLGFTGYPMHFVGEHLLNPLCMVADVRLGVSLHPLLLSA